jgi:hypothetical protein
MTSSVQNDMWPITDLSIQSPCAHRARRRLYPGWQGTGFTSADSVQRVLAMSLQARR